LKSAGTPRTTLVSVSGSLTAAIRPRMTGIDQLDADEEERAITAELRAF